MPVLMSSLPLAAGCPGAQRWIASSIIPQTATWVALDAAFCSEAAIVKVSANFKKMALKPRGRMN
jgi:hypothetical protein